MDALNQLGHGIDGVVNGDPVIGQDNQLRPTVTHLVGDVERPAGEAYRVERPALEYLPDAVAQLGAGFPGVDMLLLASNDLAQVGLGEKTHRNTRAVVKIGGVGREFPARFLNEADVQRRA